MSDVPPTIRAIAEAAGVSKSVAHRALAGRPGVAATTSAHVRAVAQELGWVPDPALSALSARRWGQGRTGHNLALVFSDAQRRLSRSERQRITRQLTLQCAERGYHLRRYDVQRDGPGLQERLIQGGVRGILLVHNDEAPLLQEWDCRPFAWVAVSASWHDAPVHRASVDIFAAIDAAAQRARGIAGKHVGWAILYAPGAITDRQRMAAIRAAGPWSVPVWRRPFDDPAHATSLQQWYRTQRPRVVVTLTDWQIGILEADGWSFPDDGGAMSLMTRSHGGRISGIAGTDEDTFRAAVDLLHSELQAGRRGLPERRLTVALGPRWCAGATLA